MVSLPLIYLIVVILKIPRWVPSDLCMTVPPEDPFLDSSDTSFLVLSRERHGTDEDFSCENSNPFKILRKNRIFYVNRLIVV